MQLVQREWLDGGHPFSLRHNHVTSAPDREKAPIFLLFLDAVWQVYQYSACYILPYIMYTLRCVFVYFFGYADYSAVSFVV